MEIGLTVVFNRPGIAGAVLQTPPSFVNCLFLQIFRTPSLPNHRSEGAEILREGLGGTFHVSHVTCHASRVICHMSCATKSDKVVKLVSGGLFINGVPRLVTILPRSLRIGVQAVSMIVTTDLHKYHWTWVLWIIDMLCLGLAESLKYIS